MPFYLLLAYFKATNLHTSKMVEEKHVRLAKLKLSSFLPFAMHGGCSQSHIYSVFTEIMGGAKMIAHWRGCMGSQVQSDLGALEHNAYESTLQQNSLKFYLTDCGPSSQ